MLQKNASIRQIAKQTGEFLSQYIHVDKLVLFGSYQYGKPREDSDFDIAVISEDFEKMNFWDKLKLFAKTTLTIDSRLELIGFSKKEYLKPESASFLAFIKKKGKIVFSRKSCNGSKKG